MSEDKVKAKDIPLLAYVIASADMRYIEINEREIYIRQDPKMGMVVRGEISGCGAGSYADLSQIFLEYAMSCEGCRDQSEGEKSVTRFGARFGTILAAKLSEDYIGLPTIDQLSRSYGFILNSMAVPFTEDRTEHNLHFTLAYCPLCDSGKKTGLNREMALARLGFAVLCESMLRSFTPDWLLLKPSITEPEPTLLEIVLTRLSKHPIIQQ